MGFPRRLLGKGSNHRTLLTQSTPTTQDQLLRAQRHKDGRIRYQCCQCSSKLMLTYLHTVQRPSQTLFQGSNPCRGHLFPTLGVRTSHWNLKDLVHSQNNSAFSSHLRLAPTKCRQLQCGQSSGNRWFSAKMRTKASESSTKANAWCAASIRRRVAWSGLTWLTSQSHSALQRHAYLKTFREYVNNFVYTYKYMQYIYICITIIYTVYMFLNYIIGVMITVMSKLPLWTWSTLILSPSLGQPSQSSRRTDLLRAASLGVLGQALWNESFSDWAQVCLYTNHLISPACPASSK